MKKSLRNEVSLKPTFDYVDKIAWGMDTPKGQSVRDNNIQDNFDLTRELEADGEYVVLPAFVAKENEVGFLLPSEDATDDQIAEQKAAMKACTAEGKVPFHYEVCYVRYVVKPDEKNPNRARASRGRRGASRKGSNIA